jgi:hypothetical protein
MVLGSVMHRSSYQKACLTERQPDAQPCDEWVASSKVRRAPRAERARLRWSRRVTPVEFVRYRPCRCNSGTTNLANSSLPSVRQYAGCIGYAYILVYQDLLYYMFEAFF